MVPDRKGVLLSEVRRLLTALRRSSRFSRTLPQGSTASGDAKPESQLVSDLESLQDVVRACVMNSSEPEDKFDELEVVNLVAPFLAVVRSPATTGPITEAALGGILNLLRSGVISDESRGMPEAVSETVDAVTNCRFEESDLLSDDLARMRMMQVLVACTGTPLGKGLSDEAAWQVLGLLFTFHEAELEGRSPMLCQGAEDALLVVVSTMMAQVPLLTSLEETKGPRPTERAYRFGLPSIVKLLGFLCSRVSAGVRSITAGRLGGDMPQPGQSLLLWLRLIRLGLDEAGPSVLQCPALMSIVKDDLCFALLCIGRGGSSSDVLSEGLCVVRSLWRIGRSALCFQIECFFNGIYIKALNGMAHDDEDKTPAGYVALSRSEEEAVMESLCDLAAEPALLPELCANYDCHLERSDVVENLLGGLATCAECLLPRKPVVHRICLETLYQALRCLHLSGLKEVGALKSSVNLERFQKAMHQKRLYSAGAARFNKKPRVGIQFLEELDLLPPPPNLDDPAELEAAAKALAQFLRTSQGPEKSAIGSYLGEAGKKRTAVTVDSVTGHDREGKPLAETFHWSDTTDCHVAVLKAFVRSFNFEGQPILVALRMFLAAFRLPVEAQQIDRIVHAFAHEVFSCCLEGRQGLFATVDVAYLLSFSIIMLNTDLHNPNIRQDRRMTLAAFIRNNENYGVEISNGKDLAHDLLESVFVSIKEQPIRTLSDGPEGEITSHRWKDLLRQHKVTKFKVLAPQDLAPVGSLMLTMTWKVVLRAASAPFASKAIGPATWSPQRRTFLQQALDLFMMLAQLACHCQLQECFDAVVHTLCGFTGLLRHGEQRGSKESRHLLALVGMDPGPQLALVTVFGIVHRLNESVKGSWLSLVRVVLALRDLRLLPADLLKGSDEDLLDSESREAFNRLVTAHARHRNGAASQKRRSLLGWVMGQNDADQPPGDAAEVWDDMSYSAEVFGGGDEVLKDGQQLPSLSLQVWEKAQLCVSQCQLSELFLDSRFFHPQSLRYLIKSLALAASEEASSSRANSSVTEDGRLSRRGSAAGIHDAPEHLQAPRTVSGVSHGSRALASVLLARVVCRNRDRVDMKGGLLPVVLGHYREELGSAKELGFAVEQCTSGLISICTRLFSREGLADTLAEALTWLVEPVLNARLAAALSGHVGTGMWLLIRRNMDVLPTLGEGAWVHVLGVLGRCAVHGGEGQTKAFEALCCLVHSRELRLVSPECTRTLAAFVRGSSNATAGDNEGFAVAALDLLMVLASRVLERESSCKTEQQMQWLTLMRAVSVGASHDQPDVRLHSIGLLEALIRDTDEVPGETALSLFRSVLLPLTGAPLMDSDGAGQMEGGNDGLVLEQKRRLELLTSAFAKYLVMLTQVQDFLQLWKQILGLFEEPPSQEREAPLLSDTAPATTPTSRSVQPVGSLTFAMPVPLSLAQPTLAKLVDTIFTCDALPQHLLQAVRDVTIRMLEHRCGDAETLARTFPVMFPPQSQAPSKAPDPAALVVGAEAVAVEASE